MTDSIAASRREVEIEAHVAAQAASIERKESWYRSLREEFGPASARREAALAAVRRGLFHAPLAAEEAVDRFAEGV